MRIKRILNYIYPLKGFCYGKARLEKRFGKPKIIVELHHRRASKGQCSKCGRRAPGYDHLPRRLFTFIPIWNIAVYFKYAPRRINCPVDGIIVEKFPWAEGKQHTTQAFDVFVAQWAGLLSWQEVARRFQTTWDTVRDAVVSVVNYGLSKRSLEGIQSIGVDELAVGKGHNNYITLVYQIDAGMRRLLWIGKKRTAKTLLRFFKQFAAHTTFIQYVCSDMWKPYLKVIAKKIPQALNILAELSNFDVF